VAGIIACSPEKQPAIARRLIVCAGMEGALPPSSRLVNAPVLAVPTSIGYGASLAALPRCWHVDTCSPNVSVVNIDNGFGAACIARSSTGLVLAGLVSHAARSEIAASRLLVDDRRLRFTKPAFSSIASNSASLNPAIHRRNLARLFKAVLEQVEDDDAPAGDKNSPALNGALGCSVMERL